jgi:HlyD family secretion protein
VSEANSNEIMNIGFVEATQVNAAFKVPGRVSSILVQEGETVRAGQMLALLESRELDAKLLQAQGAEAAAAAKRNQAAAAASMQVPISHSQLQAAQADLRIKQTSYDRLKQLYEAGGIPEQKLDEATAALDAAKAAEQSAQAMLQQVEIRQAEAMAAAGAAEQASGAVEEAKAYVDNCALYAPCDGTITLITVDPGEMVSAGAPVIEITDTTNPWVIINVAEDQIGRVALGASADITVASYPEKIFPGTIIWISDAGDFAVKKAVGEIERHDLRTFKVKISLQNPAGLLKTGMTATARIRGPK